MVITEDPLRSLPVGHSLSLRPVVFGSSDATVVPDSVRNWDYFDGALLAVGVGAGTRLHVQGTTVMVAPGLAVTAAHVLRDFLADLMSGTQGCLCIGVRAEGTFDAWKLRSLTLDGGDLAWMSLELCSAIHDDWFFSTVAITTRAPTIGEGLTIVGFRFEPQDTGSEASNAPIEVAGQLLAAAGKVQATYPEGRDAIMVPFPAIEIACGSRGGMSGGAVLDQHGLLVGVLSSGYDTVEGDGPSYAAWIIKALDVKVDIPWPPGTFRHHVRVLDLPPAACRIVGKQAMVEQEDGAVRYVPWFDPISPDDPPGDPHGSDA